MNPASQNGPRTIAVQYPAGRRGAPLPRSVRAWADCVLSAEGCARPVCIRFVDAAESQALNDQYRQKNKPTNVLSFPAELPPGLPSEVRDTCSLGDLAVCVPVVLAEAQQQHKPATYHYAHMIVHGLLHLLGYDHIEEFDAQRMEARERQLLAGFGIADPYRTR